MDQGCTRSEAAAPPPPPSLMEQQWLGFALRQAARAAPHPAPASLQQHSAAAGYRLTLSFLESMPLFQADDRTFDVRVGVNLFDEAAGCFFGPTAHSAAVEYDMRRSKGRRGFHIDLSSSLYLHTRAAITGSAAADITSADGGGSALACGSGLLAVVEVVLVDRSGPAGVACGEYSAGWCAVPLQLPSAAALAAGGAACCDRPSAAQRAAASGLASPAKVAGPAGTSAFCCLLPGQAQTDPVPPQAAGNGAPLRRGIMAVQLGAGGQLCVPVFAGSPRYLLLHALLPPEQRLPPAQLLADGAECRLHYQFEACPEAAAWAPLAPDNFLLSSRDVVPGLQRRRLASGAAHGSPGGSGGSGGGEATLGVLGIVSQMAPPCLHDVHAVVLTGLSVHLPDGFLDVVRKQAAGLWRQAHGAPPLAGCSGGAAGGTGAGNKLLLPLAELQHSLLLRVSAHNGRRFVGPAVLCTAAALEQVEGCRGQHCLVLGQDAPLAWLPADRFVAVVLELVLQQPSRHPPARAPSDSTTSSSGEGDGLSREVVLGWAAVMPFSCLGGSGGSQLAVAEGPHQLALRSGPGRWLRHSPVLDWRRLIECTNRSSPAAPTISLVLYNAPGQAVWPPPPAPVQLRQPRQPASPLGSLAPPPARPAAAAVAAARKAEERQRQQMSTAASEAETLLSVGPGLHKATATAVAAKLGRPLAVQETVQTWQIQARCDAAAVQKENKHQHPQEPSLHSRPQQAQQAPAQRSKEEVAALYSGSPTAKLARRRGAAVAFAEGASAAQAAVAAAAEATAAESNLPELTGLQLSEVLSSELADELLSAEASLQLLAFESSAVSGAAAGAQLPGSMHFTYRFFDGQPTVTAALRLEPVACSAEQEGTQLLALLPEHVASSSRAQGPAPALPLRLLDAGALQRQLAELADQGMPPEAAASLVQQQRLRAVHYLAERQLQIDVWDSSSLLQVGTLSMPLHHLLRRGQPAAEAVLRVRVQDQEEAVAWQDGAAGSVRLCSAALQGSFLLRLSCQGRRLDLGGGLGSAAEAGNRCSTRPALPHHSPLPVSAVLCAGPREVAAFEGVFVNSGSQEAWFELSVGPGNNQAAEGSSSSSSRQVPALSLVADEAEWRALAPAATLAGLAAQQAQHGCSLRVITGACFKLAANEACLLRFKLCNGLLFEADRNERQRREELPGGGTVQWHAIGIRRWGSSPPASSPSIHTAAAVVAGAAAPELAATYRVAAVLPAAPAVDRTLRLYCPAAGSAPAAPAVHAVELASLPGAGRLLGGGALACVASSPDISTMVQQGRLLLSCPAPARGTVRRFLLGIHAGAAGSSSGSSSGGGSISGGAGSSGWGCPAEVWEVFLHGLPAVRLAADVGSAASTSVYLPALAGLNSHAQVACRQRGCVDGELQAVASAGSCGGGLELCFEPAQIGRRELLLSVAPPQRPGELLLVQLDSSSTVVSRTFEVRLGRGQAASKKVRYHSPHAEPRRFVVRSLAPAVVRVAPSSAAFELDGGSAAAIKMTLHAAPAAYGQQGQEQAGGHREALVVLQSAPAADLGDNSRVEEVFRVVVAAA